MPSMNTPSTKTTNAASDASARKSVCTSSACEAESVRKAPPLQAGATAQIYRIATMDCATEEAEIRQALDAIPDIKRLTFNLVERSMLIDAPPPVVDRAVKAIRAAGFDPQLQQAQDEHNAPQNFSGGVRRLVAALLFAIAAEGIAFFAPDTYLWIGAGMMLALIAIALAGMETYRKGYIALRGGKLNINALMTVAVTGAFVIGQWPEAAMVMALYALAEVIEARAVERARNAIKGLLALAPETAEVLADDNTWIVKDAKDIVVGSIVRVKPGERIALDGVITEGRTAINQASVTGESIPVDKAVGDPVFAGTVNETGAFQLRVTAAAKDSTLARIIHAVEEAQVTRAPTQRFVDRFSAIYTPIIFVIALGVALLTPWLLGWEWSQSIYKALVLLVIACPCALVISTPVTVVSGLSVAAQKGILIKGGAHLEEARKLRAIALDKTGTITVGKPTLVASHIWQNALATDLDTASAQVAASLAGRSDHPVSKAIAAGLASRLTSTLREAKDFEALVGRGVTGSVDGTRYWLTNPRFIIEREFASSALTEAITNQESRGYTVTVLSTASQVLAFFAVADTVKPGSQEAVRELVALGITPVMLTGDNQITAEAVADVAGINDARGGLLPTDKLSAIKAMQTQYGPTAMVGDGINDAPALAQANIGFAMGAAGTDIAMEAADVVVMNDDLQRVAETVRLSRATFHVLWQNITMALGIKTVFLIWAVFGDASMWMAVFADVGASLLVVGNGLRLLRK